MTSPSSTIQVIAASSSSYAPYLSVMLTSLFKYSKTYPVHVTVLVSEEFSERERIAQAMGLNADRISYIVVSDEHVKGLKLVRDVPLATYYRLLLARIMPLDVKRVLYLDCDMMICGDLAALWDMPLGDNVLGAVSDHAFDRHHILGIAKDQDYFNGGVLIIDMEKWHAEQIGERSLEFASEHPEQISYCDQCAMNWILRGRWLKLDEKWNLQTLRIGRNKEDYVYFQDAASLAMLKSASIVHFTDPAKPWLYMSDHPSKTEYLAYLGQTPWGVQRPADHFPHNMIRKTLFRHAPALLPAYRQLRRYI